MMPMPKPNRGVWTGGRGCVRRLSAILGPLAAAATLSVGAEAASTAEPTVTVRESRGVYAVRATFDVPQPAEVALAVLTDYEQIPRFMPDVRTSVVRERSAG